MAKKLLLADDSITIQKVVSLTFAEEDYDVICVGNGEIAIEKIKELHPDVVLADIFMPRQTGYEVCEFVKSDANLVHIPVLLLVGTFEPFDKQEAARVGADGYLTKPFETTVLVQMVNDAAAKAGRRAGVAPPPADSGEARPAPEPTMQVPVGEDAGRRFIPTPPESAEEDVLETPEFPAGSKAAESFEATIISPPLARSEENLGPEEILLAEDEVAVPPSALVDEGEFAPPPDEPYIAASSPAPVNNEEEILEMPVMDTRISRPTEEDILGVFDLIHLDDIIARQRSLEESVTEEAEPEVVDSAEPETPSAEEAVAAWESLVEEEEPVAMDHGIEAAEKIVAMEEEAESEAPVEEAPVPATMDFGEEPAAVAALKAPEHVLDERLITRIAEMVVERLSEKIIREIAWEVVPDLAELLIRQEIDNMKEEGKI